MNFHSCHTHRTPGARDPWDSVQTSRSCPLALPEPPSPPWPSSLTLLPYLYIPLFPSTHPPSLPSSLLSSCLSSPLLLPSHGEFVIRRLKLWAQHFSFLSQAGEKTPNRHWLARGDRPGLMKSKLSIREQHLHIGTNEARRSPTLIPLHLTHFIDSPCFPNEMLNISPSAAARWQLLLWRWREWERNVTVAHTHVCICTQIKIKIRTRSHREL